MESQKAQGAAATPQAYTARASVSSPVRLSSYILRVLAIVLTLISAIVMGVAKESATAVAADYATGGLVALTATVKSSNSSALVYFIVVNVLAFLYTSVSLAVSVMSRASSSSLELPLSISDVLVAVLLFSCNSAAAAISVVAEKGQSHFGWGKICDVAGKFCGHVTAAVVLSMFASLAYLVLVLIAMVGLHKRS